MDQESMQAMEAISALKDGESWTWPESDYGKAEIWLKHGVYFLFEIPMYGGVPIFSGSYQKRSLVNLVSDIRAWA